MVDARRYRRLVAEIAAQVNGRHVRVGLLQLADELGRGVPAAVVDQQNLVGNAQRRERLGKPVVKLADGLFSLKSGTTTLRTGESSRIGLGTASRSSGTP